MDFSTAIPTPSWATSDWFPTGTGTMAPMDMSPYVWTLVVGFAISFVLAFGLGANDVANSFATSVGARVLTLRMACILASFFETAGAVLLGAKVSDTIRKGIFDVTLYEGMTEILIVGQIAALGGACVWLLVATYFRLPVSGTHSIVGAMIGFHLVVFQTEGVNWTKFGLIIASWFISPLLSGVMSAIIFLLYKKFVLNKDEPLEPGLKVLPICYTLVMLVNMISITFDGPELLGLNKVPVWGTVIISLGVGLITGLTVWFLVVPRLRRKLKEGDKNFSALPTVGEDDGKIEPADVTIDMRESNIDKEKSLDESVTSEKRDIAELDQKLRVQDIEKTAAETREKEPMMIMNKLDVSCDTADTSVQSTSDLNIFQRLLMRAGWRRMESGHTTPSSATPGSATPDSLRSSDSAGTPRRNLEAWQSVVDPPEVAKLCGPLQILSAVFASFAHGGNDVCNAVGPLVALWSIYQTGGVGQKQSTPVWILFYGGLGITVGLWVLGRRVIETVGNRLTPITPSSGFTMELGAATTVLAASKLGIPISTTHCKVGSVFMLGLVRSRASLEWKVFRNIILAWVVTLPITGGISAIIMLILQNVV
ncbi:sodium-dependent phosphate transporter 1-like isoform X2 [Acanthaster planci]|uniref:Phosphate transporter n=1 Tax=Acanthaster planci TaxID=133434 RepID=A0A8B7Y5M7_ACAPL|nr:sodium-dependent phosphate transporter 1-like isoform X2 [Acanthaster planci]